MKIKIHKATYLSETHTCQNCGHVYQGKVCNICGEKVFQEKQLSAGHFFHEVIDFFYHFESKVLKTLKLNFLKPGFVTKENLRGVRAPYARPVQLYLVTAVFFYVVVSKLNVTDYIPDYGDHNYYALSLHTPMPFAKPLDEAVVNAIDSAWVQKGREIENRLMQEGVYDNFKDENGNIKFYGRLRKDSIVLNTDKSKIIFFRNMVVVRNENFKAKIGAYAKTFIFILLPFFAFCFFAIFYKKIKYYGASLILATHFMVYNLCFYTLHSIVDVWPRRLWGSAFGAIIWQPFYMALYNDGVKPFSVFLFGHEFEFIHLVFWMPWFFIAFKRLFNTPWWKNLLISYCFSRLFFYLIFGVFKKVLIAFTIWTMH
ncbi:MAG: hypothetical protein RLZZ316_294 [Bacteroidota bacterium]